MAGIRFIGSEIYRRSCYGQRHPLAIPRVSTVIDLCRALGWLPDEIYIDSPRATPSQLARFHDPDYIAAVQAAERTGRVNPKVKERYGLGRNGNPIFPEIFSRPATACGGSILAAELLSNPSSGITAIYNPAGGTHHGQPDRTSGFCYFNDPALAILTMLERGLARVFYLDLDAHHGDGVQAAFAGEPRVMTLSVHEAGRWPMNQDGMGQASDRGGGGARNIPVPAGFHDAELAFVMEAAVLPLIAEFRPDALVVQCGADALADDPLSRLSLSNLALWAAMAAVRDLASRLLLLGGGGYNPWSVARCWSGVWAVLCDRSVPAEVPEAGAAVLRALTWRHSRGCNPPAHWFTTLADEPRLGPVREEVRATVREVLRPAMVAAR